MKKILNFGSLNNDRSYYVKDFVKEGETILAQEFKVSCGGKGLNQSIAIARAGGQPVYHAGAVGDDGGNLKQILLKNGVNLNYLQELDGPSGHAFIQINSKRQNCIVVYGGTNLELTRSYIDEVLGNFGNGDFLILQNEINEVGYIMQRANEKGMTIVFNPSPITAELCDRYPLDLVDYFILNEIEGAALSACCGNNEEILDALQKRFPKATIVLTIGENGVLCASGEIKLKHSSYTVPVVDTTAAGDTFFGYFVASIVQGFSIKDALRNATAASAIAVASQGAADSIPTQDMVVAFLAERGQSNT